MAKTEIIDKSKEEIRFEYDNLKRIIFGMVYLMMIVLGLFLVLIENWFAVIFGSLAVYMGTFRLLDIMFFKALIIDKNFLVKEWFVFGSKSIPTKDLKVTVAKRVWSGQIFFMAKNSSFFQNILMSFETFPIGNEGFRAIREILIKKNVIKGDEHEWNY